jgi:hypothetical protein
MQLFDTVSRWFADIPAVRRARNGRRVVVEKQAQLRVDGVDTTHVVLLRDMSISGACIRADLRLSRGDVVWMQVDGDEKPFDFTASVVEVRPDPMGFFSDFGLRLVELSLPSARALSAFISRRLAADGNSARDRISR